MTHQVLREGWLQPQGVYGYWPAQSDGNQLVLFEPRHGQDGSLVEKTRFTFPRQPDGDHSMPGRLFCTRSDPNKSMWLFSRLSPLVSKPLSILTAFRMPRITPRRIFHMVLRFKPLKPAADFLHQHIRRELGLSANQGKRYSWGYPAIPRSGRSPQSFRAPPGGKGIGHDPHTSLPIGPRTVHRRDHHPPFSGKILLGRRNPCGPTDEIKLICQLFLKRSPIKDLYSPMGPWEPFCILVVFPSINASTT